MTFYSLALFVHIVGALGLFIAIGLQWISILRLQAWSRWIADNTR